MHVTGKVAFAAAGVALGAGAMHQLDRVADRRTNERLELVDRETQAATRDWETWSSALDREFPGRRLDTPADHARFEQFLARNPAPAWLDVQHDEFTRVRIQVGHEGILSDATRAPNPQGDYYAAGFGAMSTAMGVGGVVSALRSARSLPATIGFTLGGGALAAFGVYSAISGVQAIARGDSAYLPARQLAARINSGA